MAYGDPVQWVIGRNLHRRHLTALQRASCVSAALEWANQGKRHVMHTDRGDSGQYSPTPDNLSGVGEPVTKVESQLPFEEADGLAFFTQDNASSVQTSSASSLKRWELNSAVIWLDFLKAVGLGRDQHLPFEVVAHTKISVSRPADRSGYRGRSHSLWYCDAQEQGVFRWFETAFMETFGANIPFAPSAMPPDSSDAATAISPGLHTYQLARPFIPIDQGDEERFIERWMGWLGEAAQGQLLYPSQLPELDTQGSWRRGS